MDNLNSPEASQAEERALVELAVSRDREAFGQLYDSYANRIYRYIYFRIGIHAEAEDLSEEVFVRAWEAISRFDWQKGGFAGWIFRIAHNLIIDYYRTRRETVPIETVEPVATGLSNPERVLEKEELRGALQNALHRLTPEQQQVILLRFIEGYSSREVAKIMSKSDEAIRALQYRALASLSRVLGGEKRK